MAYTDITPQQNPLYDNVAGDDWRIPVPVYQSNRTSEWDFTGWQAFAQVRTRDSGDVIIEFDTYDGTIEFDGGKMYLIADKDDTRLIDPLEYVWDCQFLEPVFGLLRTLIIECPFVVIGDVSK